MMGERVGEGGRGHNGTGVGVGLEGDGLVLAQRYFPR